MEENVQSERPTVMSVALKYGLILALISIAYQLLIIALGGNPFDGSWKGYVSFIFIIGVVVLAHKFFKENGDGFMSYGQGLGIAILTIFVSIIIGGLFNYVYMAYIDTSLFESIWQKVQEDMEAKGQNEDAIAMAVEWGKKLFWVFYVLGGLFWGLIIGLIVTIFTQKKNPEPIF